MKTTPQSANQALNLSSQHTQLGHVSAASITPTQRTGSSTPPPRGTKTTVTALAATSVRQASCDGLPSAHPYLAASSVPELRKLAQYEQLCNSAIIQRLSFFTPTPSTSEQAQASAQNVADKLSAYAAAGITPLIFMEPNDLNGNNLDLIQYANGAYDTALITYFTTLKSLGVTSKMMGMWVYLPEDNLPVWSTTDPGIFATVVTKTIQLQKQYFPGSQSSIMLDSESYTPGAGWGNGNYASLTPYVVNIPRGLVDSFGLQGFPWAAPANHPSESSLYDPRIYLRTDLAIQAAQTLGIKNIWFNTGTFAQMYASQTSATILNDPVQRQQMLSNVTQLVQQVKVQGFATSIHLFAQNKAKVNEATDWSYWQNIPGDRPSTTTFTTFAHDALAAGIPIWLYDTY